MDAIAENTKSLLSFVFQKFEAGELNNESLVQLIELSGSYLNLRTISRFSKETGLSYNGVKKCRNPRKILGVKFVIDND